MSEHDHFGDHGIDLDELRIALDVPWQRTVRRAVLGTFGPSGDHDSDFGYDQAHEG